MEKEKLLVKMILSNGQAIALYTDEETMAEMVSHPKYMKMQDDGNNIFVSLDDISAFEIMNFRKETPRVIDEKVDDASEPKV